LTDKEYLEKLKEEGVYGVLSFSPEIINHSYLLGWFIEDAPDANVYTYEVKVIPGRGLIVNPRTPFERIIDGEIFSWTVLEPLLDAEVSIEVSEELEAYGVGVAVTVSEPLSVAKEVAFFVGGREIIRGTLEEKRGIVQRFSFPQPVKFKTLTMKVLSIYQHGERYGSIGEIEVYDKDGKNILREKPLIQKMNPEEWGKRYKEIKERDRSKPVFLRLSENFMDEISGWPENLRNKIYPEYIKNCDIVGYGIFPIYDFGKVAMINYVIKGLEKLSGLAEGLPIITWIETTRGSKKTQPSQQIDVLPQYTRAEVWMAIIKGAKGIGYYTHSFWKPEVKDVEGVSYKIRRWISGNYQFALTEEMKEEIRKINDKITKLSPVILAPSYTGKIEMKNSKNYECHFKSTFYDNKIWIIAQNLEIEKGGFFEISVEGIREGEVEVFDENRKIKIKDGKFTDFFEPLKEHVYCIKR
ncbi:MAG: hypothetical protein NZ891_05460, partial [bacterium]|nr:hypothetical protein [bacterium]MDW8164170.1 hypothetical protein [Candidatus Omnitrophota bacterium]